MNSLLSALTGREKEDRAAVARAAAAKSIILSGAQAVKFSDRVIAQSLGAKKKEDPVKLLEALREEATLEESFRERALCLGYLALADQAHKAGGDGASARVLERLLLARTAGELAVRGDAFCLLSHWALVKSAGSCWEMLKAFKPEEAPEAQAVLHRATAKARPRLAFCLLKLTSCLTDYHLHLHQAESQVCGGVRQPAGGGKTRAGHRRERHQRPGALALTQGARAVQASRVRARAASRSALANLVHPRRLMMGKLEAGAKEISFLAMAARGYADAKGVSDLCVAHSEMKQKMAERDAAATAASRKAMNPGKAKAASQPQSVSPSDAERRSSSSKGGASAASNPALEKKAAKERQAELVKEKVRLQKQKADVLAYCEAVMQEEGLSEEAAVARFFHLSRQSLKNAVRPAPAASSAAKADYQLLCDLLEGRQPQIEYTLGDERFSSCSHLFERVAQDEDVSVRELAPLWREVTAFSAEGEPAIHWARLWIDGDSDVDLVLNEKKYLDPETEDADLRSVASLQNAMQSRELLLRLPATARARTYADIASRMRRDDGLGPEAKGAFDHQLRELASAPIPAKLSHHQLCHVCELLPESLLSDGDASMPTRLYGADDCAADEGELPCPRVQFTAVMTTVRESDGTILLREDWAALCEPVLPEAGGDETIHVEKDYTATRLVSSAGAVASDYVFPSWENLAAIFSETGPLREVLQALYMNALPPPVVSGEESLGLEAESLQLLRKTAVEDICLGLMLLCHSHLLEITRVREVKRFVARCLDSLEKADRPLYLSLAELKPRQLVILARFVRRLWDSNVSNMPHFMDSSESFSPSAYALAAGDTLQPTSALLAEVRRTEGGSVVQSFVNVLFTPLEDL